MPGLQFLLPSSLSVHLCRISSLPWLMRRQGCGPILGCIAEIVEGSSLLPALSFLEKHHNTKHLHSCCCSSPLVGSRRIWLSQPGRVVQEQPFLSALMPLWHLQPKLSSTEQDWRKDKRNMCLNTPQLILKFNLVRPKLLSVR